MFKHETEILMNAGLSVRKKYIYGMIVVCKSTGKEVLEVCTNFQQEDPPPNCSRRLRMRPESVFICSCLLASSSTDARPASVFNLCSGFEKET